MKKFKYILSSLLLLTIVSCGDDEFSRAYVDNEVKEALVGTLSLNRTLAAPGTFIQYTYTLPQSFNVESTLEISATSFDFNQTKSFVTVPAGQTTGTGLLTMPGTPVNNYNGLNEYVNIQLTGINLAQSETGDAVDYPFTLTSEAVGVKLIDVNGSFMAPTTNCLKMSLDWLGPYDQNDLDLFVYNAAFTARFENSESGSRFEGDFFNNPANENFPDGDYIVSVEIWTTVDDTPVPYTVILTTDDRVSHVFEGTVDPAVGFVDIPFTQTTNADGKRTFTFN